MKRMIHNGVFFGNDFIARHFAANEINTRESFFSCC